MSTPTPTPIPARGSWTDRIRMRVGYQWRNSGNPLLTRARTAWDCRGSARFPAVRSDLGGLSVSYSGLAEGLAYTLEFTELRRQSGADSSRRTTGTVRGRELRDPARLPDADLAIVGTSAARARALPRTASLVVPMRVHFVIDFADHADPETVAAAAAAAISRRERAQYSSARRRRDWSWAVDGTAEWFDFFYDRVYRATMARRHGERERTETREASYECLFRRGRMFVLREGEQRIGGALCHWDSRGRVLTLRLLGVLDGAAEHLESGAFKAVYHLLIDWCARNGVRRLDFQGTEPFLSKGTYQWKRRFGTSVVLPPNHFGRKRLWFQVRRDTPALRDFLVANPLLAEQPDGSLAPVYFHDAERPARLDLSGKSAGVGEPRLIDLDEFLAAVPRAAEQEVMA